MQSFQAIAYFWPGELISHFSIYTSADGSGWARAQPQITEIYGKWFEYIYTLNGLTQVNYIRMIWNNTGGEPWNPSLGAISILY